MGLGLRADCGVATLLRFDAVGYTMKPVSENVFVAETVGELVADFGRGAVAVGAGQGELQIFLGCFVRRICADGASRQHCQHGDGHQQPAELAHQRFCRGTSEYCGHIESFFSAAGHFPDHTGVAASSSAQSASLPHDFYELSVI